MKASPHLDMSAMIRQRHIKRRHAAWLSIEVHLSKGIISLSGKISDGGIHALGHGLATIWASEIADTADLRAIIVRARRSLSTGTYEFVWLILVTATPLFALMDLDNKRWSVTPAVP